MKKLIIIVLLSLVTTYDIWAQGTDPAYFNLREFYTHGNYGSGRTQAMGGAFTALGGDLSSAYINPAGLGFYNRSEYGLSVNVVGNNNSTNYINNSLNTQTQSSGDIGQLGIVFSSNRTGGTRLKANSFALSYTTLANFVNNYTFIGNNDLSSIGDGFAGLANEDGKSPQAIIDDYENNGFANFEYEMAYMAYIIDHFENGYEPLELSLPVQQKGNVTKAGYLGQYNVAYGANFDDKTYLGANLGIQSLNYSAELEYDETFTNQPTESKRLYYDNSLRVNGVGANITLGAIHRMNENFNIGVAITSPTILKVKDNFEQYAGTQVVGSSNDWDDSAQTGVDELKYQVISPVKANLGVSAYLPNKFGVISVEAEALGYAGMKLKDKTDIMAIGDQTPAIKDEYRNVVNLKAGMELRKGIARFRAGVNLIQDPMKSPAKYNLKQNYVIPSFGLGIRTSGFYLDASYSTYLETSSYNPYVLANGDHYSATIDRRRSNIGIAFGSFF